MTKHAIERTSPKGGPFIGTCRLCGRKGLTIMQSQDDCDNVRGLTEDDALLDTLKDSKP